MISSACVCAILQTDHHDLECSPDDMSALGFTFRIPIAWEYEAFTCHVIQVSFFFPGSTAHISLSRSEYDLQVERKERFFLLMRLETSSEAYKKNALEMIREISRYIEMKTTMDIASLSSQLVGYPAEYEQIFPRSLDEQTQEWLSSVHPDDSWKHAEYETALCILGPSSIRQYLLLSPGKLPNPYASFSHPIMERVRTLYFGSMLCPFRVPEANLLLDAFQKAENEHLHPVLALPPTTPGHFKHTTDVVDQLLLSLPPCQELSLNDWGLVRYIHRHHPSARIELGPLLNRVPRDVRMPYLDRPPVASSLHSEFWIRELRKIGIVRASTQSHEQDDPPLPLPFSLFLPFYHMNVSLQCTLRNAVQCANRGVPPPDRSSCPMVCETHAFLYPSFLHMAGMYNALLGYDRKALSDGNYIRSLMGKTGDRIVLQLFEGGEMG